MSAHEFYELENELLRLRSRLANLKVRMENLRRAIETATARGSPYIVNIDGYSIPYRTAMEEYRRLASMINDKELQLGRLENQLRAAISMATYADIIPYPQSTEVRRRLRNLLNEIWYNVRVWGNG